MIVYFGSVYFVVKTALGEDTERKRHLAEKTASNSLRLKGQKTENPK